LIYAKKVKVAQNSDDGNKLEDTDSESQTMAESKGKDIEPVDHRCCFIRRRTITDLLEPEIAF
jgi:hypothetical protein